MASRAHQFMLTLLVRKMRLLGFEPIAYDGDSYQIGKNKLKIPPTIIRHRPDVIGIDINNILCIGEVKTIHDLSSPRTSSQLKDFSKCAPVIICTAKHAEDKLSKLLKRINLLFQKNIELLIIPDELIPYD